MALRKKRLAAQAGAAEADLEEKVKSGAQGAYEALQLYRSRAIRFKSKNDPESAINILGQGCVAMLENGYEMAGVEISVLLLECLNENSKNIASDPTLRSLVYKIDESFQDTASPKRIEYLKACLKWTIACGQHELGDKEINHRLADCLWSRDEKAAAYHYAAGESPKILCDKIFFTHSETSKEQQQKRDRAIVTGVVQFLSLENLRDANALFSQFQKEQKTRKFTANSELLQFTSFLLQVCRRDAQPLFLTLVHNYKHALQFDESVYQLIMGPVAMKFFGVQPKVNPMMSMLQSMIK